MKINLRPSRKKLLFFVCFLLLVGGAVYAYAATRPAARDQNTQDDQAQPTVNYEPATDEQIEAGKQAKQQTIEREDKKTNNSPTSGNASDLNVVLTSAQRVDDTAYIRVELSRILNSGTCTLTLKKAGVVKTYTAGIQPLPNSSTCKGFDVKAAELSPGTWNINVKVEYQDLTASTSGEIAI
ncbi:hypothetical protein CR983_02750 [Candidatus Saccharibacteria bacterium]|nr:MAG: hypothetical protein CR983_02750 [Candidatus Saccharibacteria bacterium]